MKPVITADNISKRYRIGGPVERHDTFGGQLLSMIRQPLRNFQKLRNLDRFNEDESTIFWALRDISFEVRQGEVLGIIGHNGAGKSTLLKILSRITEPTTGTITIRGRVSSLLEVGTGFHPDLSGRDNIYMNGTLLGMSKREIDRKLEQIIEFSGISRHIDTPVKRYSSGMTVRLAFSVAAHLEPEILIIDEVLAVGDQEFQKKCLGKMREVSGHGRTVLFVSHNLAAVKSLCTRGICLHKGEIMIDDNVSAVVTRYLRTIKEQNKVADLEKYSNETVGIKSVSIDCDHPYISDSFSIFVKFEVFVRRINLDVTIGIFDDHKNDIFFTRAVISSKAEDGQGVYDVAFDIPANLLNAGMYTVQLIFGVDQELSVLTIDDVLSFEVQNESYGNNHTRYPGLIRPVINHRVKRLCYENETTGI